ncbi:MAG: efflux RND transporter periplasmic adaptor subunit [Planctomycetes bacterium]|nr:efflux RND transporter periplasmic adaptor subunit [Planctomycetota bacterium]
MRIFIASVLLAAVGAATWYLVRPAPEPPPLGKPERRVWATGKVEAWKQARVGSTILERIKVFLKSEGDVVQAGEAVVLLERSIVEAQWSRARAVREQAERDLARARRLVSENAASNVEVEKAETALAVAKADEAALEARLEDAVIKAPFAGVILKVYREPGELAHPEAPLFVVGDLSKLKVRAEVDELELAEIRTGVAVRIHPDSFPDLTLSGRIEKLAGALGRKSLFSDDPQERIDAKVLEAEIHLDDAGPLRPGMNVRVEVLSAGERAR